MLGSDVPHGFHELIDARSSDDYSSSVELKSPFEAKSIFNGGSPRGPETWTGGDIFPGGKLPFEPTRIVVPERLLEGIEKNRITVAQVSPSNTVRPLLDGRLPVSGDHLVEEVRKAYEDDKASLPYRVDYDKRDQKVNTGIVPGSSSSCTGMYTPATDSITMTAEDNNKTCLCSNSPRL